MLFRSPWNTGLKGFGEWLTKYRFKKGHLRYTAARNLRPIGTIVVWRRTLGKGVGRSKRKVKIKFIKVEDKKWISLARYIWKQNYGPIPKGMCVVFLDRNYDNFDLDNLALMTRGQYFNYLDAKFPKHKIHRLKLLSRSLKRMNRRKPDVIRHFWECPSCGYEEDKAFEKCPKCNNMSCQEMLITSRKKQAQ